ncbi:hypothetical protein DPMN_013706 [Dreissena polymorpha]|uniref:Uncharacterized protein n=1 Tax=Dreissena polymorpha TaxID=45954 RepID=A0A9D4N896_DREPO|nr:hypothetical protein DPMN_013706 [Dreissena polymorpha]
MRYVMILNVILYICTKHTATDSLLTCWVKTLQFFFSICTPAQKAGIRNRQWE